MQVIDFQAAAFVSGGQSSPYWAQFEERLGRIGIMAGAMIATNSFLYDVPSAFTRNQFIRLGCAIGAVMIGAGMFLSVDGKQRLEAMDAQEI